MTQLPDLVESVPATSSDLDRFLDEYVDYLDSERGLAATTIQRSRRVACLLVEDCLGHGPVCWDQLEARDVTGFLLRYAQGVKPSSAQVMMSGLRRFLRYLQTRGEIATNLASAVASVADRGRPGGPGELPSTLSAEQVEDLLASCDRTCATGQRDYAILLLLVRLGLRAGEVMAMELTDVDWRSGVLSVRGKGPRWARMPLCKEVGQALSTYLVEARPVCASQRIFLRLRPVAQGLARSSAISSIVQRALKRAGLNPKRQGAHLLRHSLATEMLRKGADLTEIGQILRHQSWTTTQLYARVDLTALESLVQPWPGGAS